MTQAIANPYYTKKIMHRDGVGVPYRKLVKWATQDYWVKPINTDSQRFHRSWRVSDVAQSGEVHYSKA
jgi:hypothetical protein